MSICLVHSGRHPNGTRVQKSYQAQTTYAVLTIFRCLGVHVYQKGTTK